jgi:hypothetical protein
VQEDGSSFVALSVIDLLEVVDVDKQDEEGFAGAASETEGLIGKHEEAATVVEPDEFVSEGEVVYVLLGDAEADRKNEAEGDERGDGADVLRIVEASAGGSNKGRIMAKGAAKRAVLPLMPRRTEKIPYSARRMNATKASRMRHVRVWGDRWERVDTSKRCMAPKTEP